MVQLAESTSALSLEDNTGRRCDDPMSRVPNVAHGRVAATPPRSATLLELTGSF